MVAAWRTAPSDGPIDMWTLQVPWWQFPLRAVVVYAVLLLCVRLSGKRTLGQFSSFDVIVLLLIAEAAQGPLTGADHSLPGGLIVIATLVALNYGVAWLSTRFRPIEDALEGTPEVLMKDGQVVRDRLRANNIPAGDFDEAMRCAGFLTRAEVHLAILEPEGKISFFGRPTDTALPLPAKQREGQG
jgi:uncharacterized membrane protein YcaP (DUF421 family)